MAKHIKRVGDIFIGEEFRDISRVWCKKIGKQYECLIWNFREFREKVGDPEPDHVVRANIISTRGLGVELNAEVDELYDGIIIDSYDEKKRDLLPFKGELEYDHYEDKEPTLVLKRGD